MAHLPVQRRLFAAAVLTAIAPVLVTAPAYATHTHVIEVQDGQCVVIAEDAGEETVVLPDALFVNNPNVTLEPGDITRSHPLHVLVHKRSGATHNPLYVYGSPEAAAACAGYVNR